MLYYKKYLKYKNKYINLRKYQNKYINLQEKSTEGITKPITKINYTYTNGDKYEGDGIAEEPPILTGKGVYKYVNGDEYDGEFENNMFNGFGTIIYVKYDTRYIGMFVNNKYNGSGILIVNPIGATYIGNFVNNMKHGFGKYVYSNNIKSEGMFINNNIDLKIIYQPKYDITLPEYEIVLYMSSHGCDIQDAELTDLKTDNVNTIFAPTTSHKHPVFESIDNANLNHVSIIFNNNSLEDAISYYQKVKRGKIKYGPPKYDHIYIFGLKNERERNNAYDGIFIVKNNIGLPNNINLFDWNNEEKNPLYKFPNNIPELRLLGMFMSLIITSRFQLKLSTLIKIFDKWILFQPVINKKLKLVIIDSSCRFLC